MKKYLQDLRIVENNRINDRYFQLKLTHNKPLPPINAAQFAEVKVDNSASTFLRRPLSIHDVDIRNNHMDFLIEIKGEGTQKLAELKPFDEVSVLFPLGNTWTVPHDASNVLLIGGGCGVAPLLYTAREFKGMNLSVTTLIGGRSLENLLRKEEYLKFGEVYTITEDGSHGEKGRVTDHSLMKNLDNFDAVYTCGPEAMMKAIARTAKENQVFCEVSLENTMACGIGACLVCVQDTTSGHRCVCTDGPVFNVNELKWD